MYSSDKVGEGGVWSPSGTGPISLVANSHPPALFVDAGGSVHFFYVRKSDGRVCTITRISPQNAWSDETVINVDAITNQSPAAVLLPGGDALVAWHGFDNNGIHFARQQGNARLLAEEALKLHGHQGKQAGCQGKQQEAVG